MDTNTKQCFRCGKTKPHTEFSRKRATSDGYSNWCKQCDSEYRKQYYADHPEKVAEKNEKRRLLSLSRGVKK